MTCSRNGSGICNEKKFVDQRLKITQAFLSEKKIGKEHVGSLGLLILELMNGSFRIPDQGSNNNQKEINATIIEIATLVRLFC
mmetsp:Transcript_35638/g.86287  ORF Transcript_35638/g.86287 Transcript_35638/m.86287 type:complete len:83 (+) Transcript_35638:197-445(+)